MKITQDIRDEVAKMEAQEVADLGMKEKSAEFLQGGGKLYVEAPASE